jgi:glc operon protein GlcG
MPSQKIVTLAIVLTVLSFLPSMCAQQPPASNYLTPYGPPVSVETAKKAAAAALAEARKNNWLMAVAVVDPSGDLVYYEKMDNTQLGSAKVSVDKARSAALFKRPTKAFQDALAGGGAGMRVLGLEGAVPVEGGVPLMADGKIIGAIGLSGDLSEHDAQCARAGADAISK